jgi:hypothetical protein
MASLSQMPLTFLENALLANPNAQFFNWNLSDFPFSLFPNGVPRSNVLAQFKILADATPSLTALSFTELATDNFQRTENPLSQGGNWVQTVHPINNGTPSSSLQANGSVSLCTALTGSCSSYTGLLLPPDQFAEITLGSANGSTWMVQILLQAFAKFSVPGDPNYFVQFSNAAPNLQFSNVSTGHSSPVVNASFQAGDRLRAAVVGATFLFYQNGHLLLSWIDNMPGPAPTSGSLAAPGYAGFSLNPLQGSLTDLTVSRFVCGSVNGGFNNSVFGLNGSSSGTAVTSVQAANVS